VRDPSAFPRMIQGVGAKSMAEWPMIDRTLWPKPASRKLRRRYPWPLEPECGWGPPPVATLITSRVCPWQCVFCSENSYIPNMGRRPVQMVIDELNHLDRKYGIGSFVIHDSMFFQNPTWLEEWLVEYPRKANKLWPYWAAARADTVRQWPELFERLVVETNWNTVSIGFESGSDRVLKILNKECTEEDNYFTIDLLTRIGDEMEAKGKKAPVFWSNIMLAIPGERPEDAFKTMRMVKYTKRILPSIAFYAPYPGSALGYQLIAEGKSRMSKENYHRFPDDEKVVGVDYQFYRDLLAGRFDAEVNKGLLQLRQERTNYLDALTKA
jgi:anaerobic magnesium-protoporphyrin IX monomethyl ester cyclase